MKAKIDAILAAVSPPSAEPALGNEAEAAKKGAVVGLVTDTAPAAREAARDLARGDVREGFDVLERQARMAELQAAEKWRRLGALARGIDTARARAAYEEAFRLQPSDFWTCVELASLRRRAGDLRAALEAARAAETAARTERERFVANITLADVLVLAGDLQGAKARFEASLLVSERLAEQNPGSAEAQRDLSVSMNKLGDVLVLAGDLQGAKARFEASLLVSERLAEQNPGSAEAQRDLWVSLWRLAQMGHTVTWGDVLERMEAMNARGTLLPTDTPFLEQARAHAGASGENARQ